MRKDSDREHNPEDSPPSPSPDSETHALPSWRAFCLWTALFLLISVALRFGSKLYILYRHKLGYRQEIADDWWWDSPLITGPGSQIIHFATEKLLPNLYPAPPFGQYSIYHELAAIVVLWFAISGILWLIGYLTITRRIARKSFQADG